jgi:hypothetical protein
MSVRFSTPARAVVAKIDTKGWPGGITVEETRLTNNPFFELNGRDCLIPGRRDSEEKNEGLMDSGRRRTLVFFRLVGMLMAVALFAALPLQHVRSDSHLDSRVFDEKYGYVNSWRHWLDWGTDKITQGRSPGGLFGSAKGWKEEWTKEFKQCFEKHGQTLAGKVPQDAEEYCGQNMGESDRWKFYLSIFIPLAEKESAFNEKAKGKNGARVPQGLFQMDEQDMRSHQCEGQQPLEAKDNICCAIKIADNMAKKQQGAPRIAAGNKGIMDAFWQPMREGMGGDGRGNSASVNNSKNHGDIKEKAKALCASNLGSGSAGGDSFDTSGNKGSRR